jgi:hypothetical protein
VHEHVRGPSSSGSVVLELGPGMGALVLHTPRELDGREIEVSPLGGTALPRTHSLVRPRTTAGGTQYAAVYPQLAAGTYTVWDDPVTPVTTVTIQGGQVTTAWWPSSSPEPLSRPVLIPTRPPRTRSGPPAPGQLRKHEPRPPTGSARLLGQLRGMGTGGRVARA